MVTVSYGNHGSYLSEKQVLFSATTISPKQTYIMSVAAFGRYRLVPATRSLFKGVDARTFATVKEGDRVPEVIFKTRVRDEKIGGPNPFTWKDVKSSDLFAKKRAVVFALPGGMLINPCMK